MVNSAKHEIDPEINDFPTKQVDPSSRPTEDAVFGELNAEGPKYRNLGWLGTSGLMMKIQVGLGVLSIPAAFDALGLVPGVICLAAIGAMTTWCAWVVGTFKVKHPEIYGVDDAAELILGPIGREIFAIAFTLSLIFASGSGMLGMSIAFNALSTHGACTAIFVAVSAIMVIGCAAVRTLHRLTWLAWIGVVSLLVATLIVAISVSVQDRPDAAPQQGDWVSDYKLIGYPSFDQAVAAVSTFVFAYGGTPLFFPVVAEMRDPRQYNKALILCQVVVTVSYVIIGIIIYYFCGSYVASPALGSAGRLIKQISYGIALPGLLAGSTLNGHMASKYFFLRFLRGSKHLTANTFVHWAIWLGCVVGCCGAGYIIASAVPIFGSLIALIGALFATLMVFIPTGLMWLYDNWQKGNDPSQRTVLWKLQVAWAAVILVFGSFLVVAGTSLSQNHQSDQSLAWSFVEQSPSTNILQWTPPDLSFGLDLVPPGPFDVGLGDPGLGDFGLADIGLSFGGPDLSGLEPCDQLFVDMSTPSDNVQSVDSLLNYTDMPLFDTPSDPLAGLSPEMLFQQTPSSSFQSSSASNSPPTGFNGLMPVLPNSQPLQTSPPGSLGTAPKRKASERGDDLDDDDSKANKRQRNTMAARKYRQKRLDLIADLERQLEEMTAERDTLKLQLARKDAEAGALREMLAKK
ncbi:N amino acid transport system [Paramyrothecium foliicola]|nr:N amino acid transport system [Paramyrothecium foliicola]